MKIKIIGTGLSGLVGSRIVELLSDRYQFVDLSLDSGVDILDNNLLGEVFTKYQKAKAVLHLAAFIDTNKAHEQQGDKKGLCYQLNVVGTKNVISQCQRYNLPLIHFSTDFVFSGEKEGAYKEEDQPDPIDWYGQTKYEAEKTVLTSGLRSIIARIAFPYRAYFADKQDIVRKIINGLKNDSLYPMFVDQIITPTFIDDIVQAVDFFLNTKKLGIFHLVGSESLSPYQLAQKVSSVLGLGSPGLVKKGSLEEYQKALPSGSRLWQKNLRLSNQKISSLGINMKNVDRGLVEIKRQRQKI
ncbi:MAG: sugar nucleotide-binding protein [Candidatus Shapirobacteria bacterium]|nr:sugar nucleotide-binding protein [Candidatus Shapirobacteria bacterium]